MGGGAVEGGVCVTGRGMIAALGYDLRTNAAAVRAGLSNGRELEFRIRSGVDGMPEAVVGHAVPDYAEGFEGFARLVRIAGGALAELGRQGVPKQGTKGRWGFYLSLPDPRRPATGLELVADDDTRQVRAERFNAAAAVAAPVDAGRRMLRGGPSGPWWGRDPDVRFATTSGHAGFALALREALSDLVESRIDAAVVGGVDSMLDEDTLVWLENTGRLKAAATPDGFQPGEAAAFVLLETAASARARGAKVFGVITDQPATAEEPGALIDGARSSGTGTAGVVLDSLLRLPGGPVPGSAWVISDHNGENYRAMDWGHAVSRLAGHGPEFANLPVWHPAASLGDTGAASGAIALCLATAAFERGYAPARSAVLLSASDGHDRAAVLVHDPVAA